MKINKVTLLILAIFLIAVFLRFARIEENLLFSGEKGDNYLAIKSTVLTRQLPLLGPPTSHPWLYFGPLYYWLMIPVMIVFNFNPIAGTYLGIVAGSLVIILNFSLIRKIFSQNTALFSSFLIGVSPLWIGFSRSARFYFLAAILFYPLLWALDKIWQDKMQFLFWVGLVFGVMLNFHLTPIILVPIILMILWQKKKSLRTKDLWLGFFGFLIPNLPFLIYDLIHGFRMTTKLLIWIPYRLAGFLRLYPKNNLTPEVFKENLVAFFNFISQSFVPEQEKLGILLVAAVIIFIILNFKKAFTVDKKENFGWFFVFWALILGFIALFIHGSPPIHYFVPIFPIPIIIFSLFLEKLWRNRLSKALILGLFSLILFLNLRFFLSSPFFYAPQEEVILSPRYVPYKLQKEIVRMIVEDARGEEFNLGRVGPFDYFEGDFAQNYRYLAWWFGNEPTEEKVRLGYTIYEDQTKIPKELPEGAKLFQTANMAVLKEKE